MIAPAPQFTKRNYRWVGWKTVYAIKQFLPQFEDDGNVYTIWGYDGPEVHICQIWKSAVPDATLADYTQEQNDTDKAEFEAGVKLTANATLSQIDTDGAQITRNKAAKKGWTFCSLPVEFATSRLYSGNSAAADDVFAQDPSGTARTFITCKIYDGSNAEITTPGLLGANYNNAIKTVLDIEPPYDYEIIGGELRTLSDITGNCRLWLIAAPDIAAPNGSKEMGGGINLKYLSPGNIWAVDGRVTKFATYNATFHTNKVRLLFKYDAGLHENLQVVIQLYKL